MITAASISATLITASSAAASAATLSLSASASPSLSPSLSASLETSEDGAEGGGEAAASYLVGEDAFQFSCASIRMSASASVIRSQSAASGLDLLPPLVSV